MRCRRAPGDGSVLRHRETGEIWAFTDHHLQRPLFEVLRADPDPPLPPCPSALRPPARQRLSVVLSHERGAAEWL